MSTILSCPSCANPLRVPAQLRGQQVRCPSCSEIFTTPEPEPRTEDRGPRTEDRKETPPSADGGNPPEGWKELPLELSLDEPSRPPQKSEPAAKEPGLVGAVELKLSLDDDEPASAAPPSADRPPAGRPPPRLAEDDDDLKPCPACGKSNHHDARSCSRCGEDFSDHRPRSRHRSREPIRRDAEPHRGNTVLTLGIISLVATPFCGLVGLALGLTAWVMGHSDLRKIRAGRMDRDGENSTQSGLICGIIGTCLNGLMSLCCLTYFGFIFAAINNAPKPPTRPWTPPPTIKPAPPVQPPWKENIPDWKDKKMN